jgi:hypothetical protein
MSVKSANYFSFTGGYTPKGFSNNIKSTFGKTPNYSNEERHVPKWYIIRELNKSNKLNPKIPKAYSNIEKIKLNNEYKRQYPKLTPYTKTPYKPKDFRFGYFRRLPTKLQNTIATTFKNTMMYRRKLNTWLTKKININDEQRKIRKKLEEISSNKSPSTSLGLEENRLKARLEKNRERIGRESKMRNLFINNAVVNGNNGLLLNEKFSINLQSTNKNNLKELENHKNKFWYLPKELINKRKIISIYSTSFLDDYYKYLLEKHRETQNKKTPTSQNDWSLRENKFRKLPKNLQLLKKLPKL